MTTYAGVLGFPVAHSRSPAMMNAAFAELGLDWRYFHLPLAPERLEAVVRALPASGYRGANVTIPHKLAAHALCDELGAAAGAIGAVNTLTFEDDGRIAGDNTDAGGLLDALGDPAGRALVLGAGGAARAAVWALGQAGVEVVIWNRSPERARALADEFGAGQSDAPAGAFDMLVNATAVGLGRDDTLDGLPLVDAGLVVDLVYGSERTPLARRGLERGARVVDGLEVLVRQGARSFERWTGRPAPLDIMRRAAAMSSRPSQA